jgi:Leucine-rich repeat (LRR) protein
MYNILQIFCVALSLFVVVQSYRDLRCKKDSNGDWCVLEEYGSEKDLKDVELNSNNPSVSQLFLGNMSAHYLPIALAKFPKILGLSVENCELFNLTSNKFGETKKLKDLDINRNNISTISDDSFQGAPHIEVLKLMMNQIQVISEFAFRGLSELKELKLNHNKIQILEANLFFGLKSLNHLNISYNQIDELKKGLFETNQNLQEFDASRNKISKVFPFIFNNLTLMFLDLSDNICINKKWTVNLNLGEFYEIMESCFEYVEDPNFKDESSVLNQFYAARREMREWKNKFILFFVLLAIGNIVPAVVCGVLKCRKKKMFCFKAGLGRLNSREQLIYNEYTD